MRGHQRGVEINDHLTTGPAPGPATDRATMGPHGGAGAARACRNTIPAASTSPANDFNNREIVGSEATAPNNSGWHRTTATSTG